MKHSSIELDLTKYSKRGVAQGSLGSKKVEVRGAMVGETVAATVRRKRKGVHLATLERILTPSPDRTPSRCGHFPKCGGCTFQMLPYPKELEHKQSVIAALFGHSLPILPSPSVWEYRNKMEYTFSQDKEGTRYLGLIEAGSRGKVIPLTECHLTKPWFIEVKEAVAQWWEKHALQAYHMPSNAGHLRNLIVREGTNTKERMVILVVSGVPEFALPKEAIQDFVTLLKPFDLGDSLHLFLQVQQAIPGKPTQVFEVHLYGREWLKETLVLSEKEKYSLKISPSAFFQPNTAQAGILYSKAIEIADPSPSDVVYDLYCGTGTIGMAFSPYVDRVLGVELNPYAVYDAQANIEENGIDNVEVVKGDVGKVLEEMKAPDIAIVDPPRPGLEPKAMGHILRLKPKKLLYISCNPYTQKENVDRFVEEGYTLQVVQPVDQFPHTPHCENIVLLTRSS